MAVYAQSCMVNPPSNSQLQRAPISFVRSKNSVVHADAVSILKRTTGPTLIYISVTRGCLHNIGGQDSQEKDILSGFETDFPRGRVTWGEECSYHTEDNLKGDAQSDGTV